MRTPCCEPGCTAEVLCAVHEDRARLAEAIRHWQEIAYVAWRTAVPGDVNTASEAGARATAYGRVLDLLEDRDG